LFCCPAACRVDLGVNLYQSLQSFALGRYSCAFGVNFYQYLQLRSAAQRQAELDFWRPPRPDLALSVARRAILRIQH
jgi:hypothetical protein